ncbi:1-acyl-sn-glycerol-3-phosphate acyltransferase 2 [Raphanus sativus]|nr:1-acyl-sn-glycerol-3-phosphate acyltransferase 2 [Raphanus sativus]
MAMAAAVIVPLGLLFFVSGLLVNLLQAICYVLIRPLSKNTYRKINRVVAETLWLELVWIVDWWAGVKIKVFTDNETFNRMGKEHALVVCNHRSDIDWLVGWILAQRSGCLGSALAVTKKSSKFLPVIGWSMWFSEYLFLERNWAKDENTIKSGLRRLSDFPQPFWLALFVEGTRFTETKLKAAQEYAASSELRIPRNVLIPRTKGFVSSVSNMRSFVPSIYDMTVAIPKTSPPPTMLRLFKGQPSVVHVHIKCHSMKDLPESDEAIAQWCINQFVAKDALLDEHIAADTFPGQQEQNIGRPIKSLAVVLSWACILTLGAMKFLHWANLFSSWKGMALSALGLGIITLCMQILIRSSQSERSTPAKPNDHHHAGSPSRIEKK